MGRRGVAAVEAITRRKVAAHHHEAGGGLDAESPKQARIDPERLGGIIALPEREDFPKFFKEQSVVEFYAR